MSRRATLSLMGVWQYDNTITDAINTPNGMDRQIIISNILIETSELELVYTEPMLLRYALDTWSRKQMSVWQRLWDTMQIEYNPLFSSYREEHRSNVSDITNNGRVKSDYNTVTDTVGDTEVNGSVNVLTEDEKTETVNDVLDGTHTNSINIDVNTTSEENTLNEVENNSVSARDSQTTVSETEKTTNSGSDKAQVEYMAFNSGVGQTHDVTTTTFGHIVDRTDNTTTDVTESVTTNEKGKATGNTTGTESVNTARTDTLILDDKKNVTTNANETGTSDTTSKTDTHNTNKVEEDNTANSETNNAEHTKNDMWFDMKGSGENNNAQELITQELELRKFNVYDYIVEDFKRRFCILVY